MKTKIKYIGLLSLFIAFGSFSSHAQLRVANYKAISDATNSSAFLDASSWNEWNLTDNIGKGLLYPRVDLTKFTFSYTSFIGIMTNYPTRFDGFTVYNTATSGKAAAGATQGTLSPGYWYYDNKTTNINGGTWKPVGNGIQAMTTVVRDSITTPYIGQTIYNITDSILNTYNGNRWITVGGGGTITFSSGGQINMKLDDDKGLYSNISAVGFGNSTDLSIKYGSSLNLTGKNSGFAFDASQSGKVTAISATYTAAIDEDFGGTLYVQLLEAKAGSTIFTPMPGVNIAVGSFASVKSGMLLHNYVKGLNASITAGNRYMIIFYVKANKATNEDFEGWAGGSITIQ